MIIHVLNHSTIGVTDISKNMDTVDIEWIVVQCYHQVNVYNKNYFNKNILIIFSSVNIRIGAMLCLCFMLFQ